jgi:hypothetical protein
MAVTGSLKELTIAGQSFNPAADANVSFKMSGFEVDRVVHSVGSMKKMIRQLRTVENVVVIANGNERSALKLLSEATDDYMISFVDASGDNYQALGSINFEQWESEENRVTMTLQAANDWTEYLA